jgi:hypothetical protein
VLSNIHSIIGDEKTTDKSVWVFLAARQREVNNLKSSPHYEQKQVIKKLQDVFEGIVIVHPNGKIVTETVKDGNSQLYQQKKLVKTPMEETLSQLVYDIATALLQETLGNSSYFSYNLEVEETTKKQFKDKINKAIVNRLRYLWIDMILEKTDFVNEVYNYYEKNSKDPVGLKNLINKLIMVFIANDLEFTDKVTFVINNIINEFASADSVTHIVNDIFEKILTDTDCFKRNSTIK